MLISFFGLCINAKHHSGYNYNPPTTQIPQQMARPPPPPSRDTSVIEPVPLRGAPPTSSVNVVFDRPVQSIGYELPPVKRITYGPQSSANVQQYYLSVSPANSGFTGY